MTLSLALLVLAQAPVPVNPGPPPLYFTEFIDHAGSGVAGAADGQFHFFATVENPTWIATVGTDRTWFIANSTTPGSSAVRYRYFEQVYTWTNIPISANEIGGLAVNPSTYELYFTVPNQHVVYRIAQYNAVPTVFAGSLNPVPCTVSGGACFAGGFQDGVSSRFNRPSGIGVDASGSVFVADSENHALRKLTPTGVASTGFQKLDFLPSTLVLDEARGRLVVESRGGIYSLTFAGQLDLIAGLPGLFSNIWADGDVTTARFANPAGLAVDAQGNIFVADHQITGSGTTYFLQGAIRQITPGQTFRNLPRASYATVVRTLPKKGGSNIAWTLGGSTTWFSSATLTHPVGLAWVGGTLAVTDTELPVVRVLR